MNADERDKLRNLVAEQIGADPAEITTESNLEDLGMNSLDRIEIAMAIEDEFNIERIDDDDMSRVTTFGDLVQLITNTKQLA